MKYILKKRIIVLLIIFAGLILVAGYAVGNYFVNYALKRGNATDPLAPPAACVKIHDKNRTIPAPPSSPSEKWSITATNGRRLAATYYIPAETGHLWAILIHGYGRDQRYTWDYAEPYLKKGYNVLTPDLCAAGESEGQYITMGVKESEEVALWAAKIKERDPEAKIVLHGVSMGAATALLTAGQHDIPGLCAVIEDCGYTSAYEMFSNQLGVIFGLPEFPIMPCVDMVSNIKTGVKVSDAAPLKAVPNIKVPVMFIHGSADKLVPPAMMEDLYNSCNAPKTKLIVPGAGHGDAMKADKKAYWDAVFGFLENIVNAINYGALPQPPQGRCP